MGLLDAGTVEDAAAQTMYARTTGSRPFSTARMAAKPRLPFLPGYSGQMSRRHGKTQSLVYSAGGPMVVDKLQDIPKLNLDLVETMCDTSRRRTSRTRRPASLDTRAIQSARTSNWPARPPAWLQHDRQVLRFAAYFQEPVTESQLETFRVRQCTICYFLEDATMMVTEPRVENSGLSQGNFIRRHRIPKTEEQGGGYFGPEDLKCGATVTLYSRDFRIAGCDRFTRDYYVATTGEPPGEPEEVPADAFARSRMRLAVEDEEAVQIGSSRRRRGGGINLVEAKAFAELAAGGRRRDEKMQQYIENDRKVLCFRCYWDDPTPYGGRHFFLLHYFLADDTVEMLNSYPRNSGRDPYPVFWRRSALSKQPYVNSTPGMTDLDEYYKPEDLLVGGTVEVYGREVFLYDCDQFTRSFYREYMDFEQESIKVREVRPVYPQLACPPHIGIGTEEDSLASCLHLTPKAPRRDLRKLMDNAHKLLRFHARPINRPDEEARRRFIVGLYLADDSVAVWELKQRNSGFLEWRFASRSRKTNPATGTWFKPADFHIGAIIEISAVVFLLLGADEYTLKFMEEQPSEFPFADAAQVTSKLSGLSQVLRALPTGDITAADLRQLAHEHLGADLNAHELATLQRACGDAGQDPPPQGLQERAAGEDVGLNKVPHEPEPKPISVARLLQLIR